MTNQIEMTEVEMMEEHRNDSMVRLQNEAELENAEFDRKAAEEEARRQERVAAQHREALATRRARGGHLTALSAALVAAGHQSTFSIDEWQLTCDGVDLQYQFSFASEYTSSTWRSRPTGKMRMAIGNYGNRTSFPQRKDGTFNYAAAAQTLARYATGEIEKNRRQSAMRGNKADAVALQQEFNLPEYNSVVSPSSRTDAKTVVVSLKELSTTALVGTPDQIRHILKTLRELGFKLSYNG